jgi:hypothetical protein
VCVFSYAFPHACSGASACLRMRGLQGLIPVDLGQSEGPREGPFFF